MLKPGAFWHIPPQGFIHGTIRTRRNKFWHPRVTPTRAVISTVSQFISHGQSYDTTVYRRSRGVTVKVPGDLANRSMACHYHVVVLEPLGAGCGCPGSVRGICIADVDSRYSGGNLIRSFASPGCPRRGGGRGVNP